MSLLMSVEVVTGALILVAGFGVLFLYIRRQIIAGGQPLVMCALRTEAAQPWRLGLLRFGATTLDWFSVAGPSLRPTRSWRRRGLAFGLTQPTGDEIPGLIDPLTILGTSDGGDFQLAMGRDALNATRSWAESAPPGFRG